MTGSAGKYHKNEKKAGDSARKLFPPVKFSNSCKDSSLLAAKNDVEFVTTAKGFEDLWPKTYL